MRTCIAVLFFYVNVNMQWRMYQQRFAAAGGAKAVESPH